MARTNYIKIKRGNTIWNDIEESDSKAAHNSLLSPTRAAAPQMHIINIR